MNDPKEHFRVTGEKISSSGRVIPVGEFFCILNGKTYSTERGLINFIRERGYTSERYYTEFYSNGDNPCEICGNKALFKSIIDGFSKWCSNACACRSEYKLSIIRNRFVNQPEKKNLAVSRLRETYSKRTEAQKEESKNKFNASLDKNGTRKVLTENGIRLQEYLRKERIADGGARRKLITEKSLKTKEVNGTFKSGCTGRIRDFEYNGIVYKVQGYEDILLTFLVDRGIEFRYGAKEVPEVFVPWRRSKKYMADFFLPEYNLLLDVKSEYTFDPKNEELKKLQQLAIEQGFDFYFFVIDSSTIKKQRILSESYSNCFLEYLNMLISSQALNSEGRFNDYPVIRSTTQAIGVGSADNPLKRIVI